jgi:hypothetical protein
MRKFSKPAAQGGLACYNEHISAGFLGVDSYIWLRSKAIADEGCCIMSFDVITKEHLRPHPKLLAVVQKQLLLYHIESKIYPAALLKRLDLTGRFDLLETTYHAIPIHKLGLYPLNRLWRPPQAAVQRGRSPPCAPPSAAARRVRRFEKLRQSPIAALARALDRVSAGICRIAA